MRARLCVGAFVCEWERGVIGKETIKRVQCMVRVHDVSVMKRKKYIERRER